jgi:REP element-mobilizing transposase RayT
LDYQRKSHIEIGEIYFWTATIHQWQHLLLDDRYKEVIVGSLEYLSAALKVDVFGFVIMPNHVHVIWRMLAQNGSELPHASLLKYTAHQFKKMLVADGGALASYAVEANNKSHEFWQRDSLAVPLYTKTMAYQKLDYLHQNPLAEHWSLAKDPCEYKYSTARFYEQGINDFGFTKDLREEF